MLALAPSVVFAALAFWAPHHDGHLPCAPSARPITVQAPDAPPSVPLDRPAWADLGGGCDAVYVRPEFYQLPPSTQCEILAHEYGHAVEGYDHTPLQGIMNGDVLAKLPTCERLDRPEGPARQVRVQVRSFKHKSGLYFASGGVS